MYWAPFRAKMLATTIVLSLEQKSQLSVNNFLSYILDDPRAAQQH
jgi:hypothetical protein